MDVIGLSEVRWEGKGELKSGQATIFYSGEKRGKNGVGIIMRNEVAKRVQKVLYVDDRMMAVRIGTLPKDLLIIQVYMPTSAYEEEDIEKMYEKMEDVLKEEGDCCTVIMGDWNAVVGEGEERNIVGKYGLGVRNERGDRLVDFCREKKLFIANTWFKDHERRRYTWVAPGEDRYQIDYFLVEERYRNAVKKAKGLPGADINSDHVLIMMEVQITLKKVEKAKLIKKWNLEKIVGIEEDRLGEKLSEAIKEDGKNEEGSDETWERIKGAIVKTAEKEVGYYEGIRAKKPWVTTEMLEKMEERRKYKNKSEDHERLMYRRLNNELRRETQKAREKWLREECDDIEDLQKKGQYDLIYRKVRNITADKRKKKSKIREIENGNGKIIHEKKEIKERWAEYLKDLYCTEEKPENLEMEKEEDVLAEDRGASVLQSEVEKAIKEMKRGKTTGVDEIPIEFFKCLKEEGIKEIVKLCNRIYHTGEWPEDFVRTVIVPIPKKTGTRKCAEHRTISLISHAAKILLRVMNRRLIRIMEENAGEEQFGFRKGKGTRDAIGLLRMIGERYMERGKGMSICFIDLEKAFDRVKWVKLMDILKEKGMRWKERRLIRELYMKQKAGIKVEDDITEWVELGRGVRQGCSMSPTLFNIYIEEMINKVLYGREEGVSIGGRKIRCIRFADDMVVMAEDLETIQRLIKSLEEGMNGYGMKINLGKTKVMEVGTKSDESVKLREGGIEKVRRYNYLGTMITDDWRSEEEIKKRIAMAKEAFGQRKNLLCSQSLDLELRKRLAKCYTWSVLLYGSEAWTLRKRDRRKVEAFEMWVWRRMEKIRWVDRVKNEEVLNRVGEERSLIREIRRRKGNWLGHVMRGSGVLSMALEGSVEGVGRRGRRRIKFVDEVKSDTYETTKRKASDRERWRQQWYMEPANRQNTK